MKIRRIPETDLARITVLDPQSQWTQLKRLRNFKPPHTYKPTKTCVPDILNEQGPFTGSEPTPWDKIDELIAKTATHQKEYEYNRAVAYSLHGFCTEHRIVSRRKPIAPWPVGFGHHVVYWWDLYCLLESRAVIPFIEPRLNNPMTALARLFAFSLIHERVRVSDPDFADAALLILQFGKGEEGYRPIRPHWAEGLHLFDSGEINEMVSTTYRIWKEVLSEREEMERKTGTDDLPLFEKR